MTWAFHPLRAVSGEVVRLVGRVRGAGVVDDGVRFDVASLDVGVASLDVGPIREDQEYGGVRITLRAEIGSALVRLQVDVGFGDAITPGPQLVEFPPLLDFDAPKMRAYPRSTVVAEKFEAMVPGRARLDFKRPSRPEESVAIEDPELCNWRFDSTSECFC